MLFISIIYCVLVYIVLPFLLLMGPFVLLPKLLKSLQKRGVGVWLFAPFRAWTGMDKPRRPRM